MATKKAMPKPKGNPFMDKMMAAKKGGKPVKKAMPKGKKK